MNGDNKEFKSYYIKEKENQIKKLDLKNKDLNIVIEKEKLNFTKLGDMLKKEKLKNVLLNDRYNNLIKHVKEHGIVLSIVNDSYNSKEWENVHLFKDSMQLYIKNVHGQKMFTFSEKASKFIEELLEDNDYSIVVTRVDSEVKMHFSIRDKKVNKD